MKQHFARAGIKLSLLVALAAGGAFSTLAAVAEPQHGIAMYGEPALPPDFVSLPYANPDAPKGGLCWANRGDSIR